MTEPPDQQPRPADADDDPVLPSSSPEDRDEFWGDEPRSRERDADWYRRSGVIAPSTRRW